MISIDFSCYPELLFIGHPLQAIDKTAFVALSAFRNFVRAEVAFLECHDLLWKGGNI